VEIPTETIYRTGVWQGLSDDVWITELALVLLVYAVVFLTAFFLLYIAVKCGVADRCVTRAWRRQIGVVAHGGSLTRAMHAVRSARRSTSGCAGTQKVVRIWIVGQELPGQDLPKAVGLW